MREVSASRDLSVSNSVWALCRREFACWNSLRQASSSLPP
ncbi:MAG: hypothetical protein ACD_55C00047G0001 [uncultured bacterium]|nr:MAG: hypothetical protein ACD_55C00047G0001 [uncultured bacterium]